MRTTGLLYGNMGYDSAAVRRKIEEAGVAPNIPPPAEKRWKTRFSPHLYRDRNVIERMFGRLKDLRRIATRYDRSATNFMAAVQIAATVAYWLCVRTLKVAQRNTETFGERFLRHSC
jgi:transposase